MTAPGLGTTSSIHRASGIIHTPSAAPFVSPGDFVKPGQTLCIVEAMKLMNEIECDVSGEIVKRIAVTGQPVEFGEPLAVIE